MKNFLTTTTLTAALFAAADSARGANDTPVSEIVTFKLVEGVGDAAFLDHVKSMEPFLRDAPEFVSRRLTKGEEGIWTDYLVWNNLENALRAGEALMVNPALSGFISAIDPDTDALRHEKILLQLE